MSEHVHPGMHPDPDSLNAFIEGALPEHERAQCLAHFAECAHCREVVFLAQERPTSGTAREPHPERQRWWAAPRFLAAAAAMCIAFVAIWLHSHSNGRPYSTLALSKTAAPSAAPLAEQVPAAEALQAPRAIAAATPLHQKVAVPPASHGAGSSSTGRMTLSSLSAPNPSDAPRTIEAAAPPAPLPQPTAAPVQPQPLSIGFRELQAAQPISEISGTVTDATGAAISGAVIKVRQPNGTATADTSTDSTGEFHVALPAGRYDLQIVAQGFRETSRQIDLQPRETASIKSQLEKTAAFSNLRVSSVAAAVPSAFTAILSGISGAVTDPTGAAISGATIKIRQLGGTVTTNARTDATGQFHVEPLPAGRYELQIGAPGFSETSRQVELKPREIAKVQSQLEVGSVSETVEVTAAASTLQTAAASVRGVRSLKTAPVEGPRPLPSELAAVSTVTSGRNLLSLDTAGAVFFSGNFGKDWKAVKPVWPGKVNAISLADGSQNAMFQITTDAGSVWLSRDGTHWRSAIPQH